ncbi:MAG TPA: aldehyde ferredoxin oxidoreductase C-terminal domain-containing protein [Dehalococcoidales bacterium]|nr:aldehyde ferredoxin oxidoreductase C-terminal domain-containing protein [Dehalococcoidales bacterium]
MPNKSFNGYTGKVLRVNLSTGEISVEYPPENTYRRFVGGTGMGAKYLYDEVPAGVEWNNPENRLIWFTGPLAGTRVSGSGTFSVVTRGPMTNMAGATQANGYFGAFLKLSGFDGIILQGRCPQWQYLYIHDDTAELRDASHLLGMNTNQTEDHINKEIKEKCSVFGIGPAGENLVRFAAIVGDGGHVAGHNGSGAVMGSKKLKAIVVKRGEQTVKVANPSLLAEKANMMIEDAMQKDPNLAKFGTANGFQIMHVTGQLPVRNYTTNIFPEAEKFTGQSLRTNFKMTTVTCWACRLAHLRSVEITEGPYAGFVGEEPEYEAVAAMSSLIGQTDPAAMIVLCNTIDRLGMDINETGYLIGWMMECYAKGYLGKEDFDGIAMEWGNAQSVLQILEKVARRSGCGAVYAEGVKKAAEKIGGDALKCAVYTQKGASPRGHDHRARWNEIIDTCLSNTGTVEVGPGLPFADILGLPPLQDKFDGMAVSTIAAGVNGARQFEDCLGICFFCVQDFRLLIDCVNAVTGWDMQVKDAMLVGKRIVNLLRLFNFRHGLTADIEMPSLRYGSMPGDGPAQGKHIMPQWEALRRNYYQKMGWDPETGVPLKQTLEQLGLNAE